MTSGAVILPPHIHSLGVWPTLLEGYLDVHELIWKEYTHTVNCIDSFFKKATALLRTLSFSYILERLHWLTFYQGMKKWS